MRVGKRGKEIDVRIGMLIFIQVLKECLCEEKIFPLHSDGIRYEQNEHGVHLANVHKNKNEYSIAAS